MHTQITCPQCRTPYRAEVHQIVDSALNPDLKQKLLNGQLNVAVCPSCGTGGQLSTPLLFHDPEHETFIVHMPQEMQLGHMQQEQLIGQLTQQLMNAYPAEKRRAYMLQPQTVLSMQTFMEKVLETEGITKEMIERQRKQADLLQTLAKADSDVVEHLVKDRMDEIDETFFAMLQSFVDTVAKSDSPDQLVKLTNLRYKLMTETPVGQQLEKQQMALHKFNQAVKKQGGLTPALLLEHILANLEEDTIIESIISMAQQGLSYEFFTLLTNEIESREKAGDKPVAEKLSLLRERLLAALEMMREQSDKMMADADELLSLLLQAPDKKTAVQTNMSRFDDAFMHVLSLRIAQATEKKQDEEAQALNEIYTLILQEAESHLPPEVRQLNKLIQLETEQEQIAFLEQNQTMLTSEFIDALTAIQQQMTASGREEISGRLEQIKGLIKARI